MFNEDQRLVDIIHLLSPGKTLRSVFVGHSKSTEISPVDGLTWNSLYLYCNRDSLMDLGEADLEDLRVQRSIKEAERAVTR